MRAVVQRISQGEVCVDNQVVGSAKVGLMVLVGFNHGDIQSDKGSNYIQEKILNLRVFEDQQRKMNLSVQDIKGDLLIVPNFTLYGDCRKGRRPSSSNSASVDAARNLYDKFIEDIASAYPSVASGVFQGDMAVDIVNDGPVTLILDSDRIL